MGHAALTDDEAADLRWRIREGGLEHTATNLGLNTTTLLRAACGLQLNNATCQLIKRSLTDAQTPKA